MPVGLYIGHTRRATSLAVGLANVGRAIPTFAMMGILLPFTQSFDPALGFTLYPTLLAMIILAIPPILVNTYAGVSEVDRDLVEAARGMGFRGSQILRGIEIPLALPVILGGVRSAAVQVIATTTLGAILGRRRAGPVHRRRDRPERRRDAVRRRRPGRGLAMLSELLLSRRAATLERAGPGAVDAPAVPPAGRRASATGDDLTGISASVVTNC